MSINSEEVQEGLCGGSSEGKEAIVVATSESGICWSGVSLGFPYYRCRSAEPIANPRFRKNVLGPLWVDFNLLS